MNYNKNDSKQKSVYQTRVKPFLSKIKVTNFTLKWLFFGTKLELWELGKVLDSDENLIYVTPGKYAPPVKHSQKTDDEDAAPLENKPTRWLIVVTSRRIIFLDKGFIVKNIIKTIYLNKINGVDAKKGLFFGQVQLVSNSGEDDYIIGHLWNQDTYRLRKAIEDTLEASNPAFNGSDQLDDLTTGLEKIKLIREALANNDIDQEVADAQIKAIKAKYNI